jgi:hypothetical protein
MNKSYSLKRGCTKISYLHRIKCWAHWYSVAQFCQSVMLFPQTREVKILVGMLKYWSRMWKYWFGCESTGPRMWKYWSPDMEVLVPGCVKFCPEMLPEKLGTFLRKMKAYGWLYRQNYSLSEIMYFWWNPSLSCFFFLKANAR